MADGKKKPRISLFGVDTSIKKDEIIGKIRNENEKLCFQDDEMIVIDLDYFKNRKKKFVVLEVSPRLWHICIGMEYLKIGGNNCKVKISFHKMIYNYRNCNECDGECEKNCKNFIRNVEEDIQTINFNHSIAMNK